METTAQEPTMPARQRKFRTNGTSLSPVTGVTATARAITAGVITSREQITQDIATLSVGGVTGFPVKDPADSGGATHVLVERVV
jgi:hypothetical protein